MARCHSAALREDLEGFLAKTETQRVARLNKLAKTWTDDQVTLFFTLALVAAMHAKELIELRDTYRLELAPGLGNRATAAGIYAHASRAAEILGNMLWPAEAFDAVGISDSENDDED